jgi:hypothetical protein
MSNLEVLTGRNYLSYSALQSLLDCGERFRLERIEQVPQTKAWWFIGGSAFHTASEYLDRGDVTDVTEAWETAWDQAVEHELAGVDLSTVRAGGRSSKQWPDKENSAWWKENGLLMLQDYAAWRAQHSWQLLETPGSNLAIEVPVQLELGQTLVKGYIDRVFVTEDGELVIVDLKTGSHKPASSLQLGVYALGVEHHLGVRPILGSYYMARKAELTEPTSLLHYTPELVGSWFSRAKQTIEAELFIPHVTSLCGTCSVRDYCAAVGGIKSASLLQPAS